MSTRERCTQKLADQAMQIMHELDCAIMIPLLKERHELSATTRLEDIVSGDSKPHSSADHICSICYEDLEVPAPSLCARHTFCRVCIASWLKIHPSCPTCRHDIHDFMRDLASWAKDDNILFTRKLQAAAMDNEVLTTREMRRSYVTSVQDVWLHVFESRLRRHFAEGNISFRRHWTSLGFHTYLIDRQRTRGTFETVTRRMEELCASTTAHGVVSDRDRLLQQSQPAMPISTTKAWTKLVGTAILIMLFCEAALPLLFWTLACSAGRSRIQPRAQG